MTFALPVTYTAHYWFLRVYVVRTHVTVYARCIPACVAAFTRTPAFGSVRRTFLPAVTPRFLFYTTTWFTHAVATHCGYTRLPAFTHFPHVPVTRWFLRLVTGWLFTAHTAVVPLPPPPHYPLHPFTVVCFRCGWLRKRTFTHTPARARVRLHFARCRTACRFTGSRTAHCRFAYWFYTGCHIYAFTAPLRSTTVTGLRFCGLRCLRFSSCARAVHAFALPHWLLRTRSVRWFTLPCLGSLYAFYTTLLPVAAILRLQHLF